MKLLTYLKSITEFDLKYGYLIYWYYDYKKDIPYIHKVCTKKIVLDADNEDLFQKPFTSIKKLLALNKNLLQLIKLNLKNAEGVLSINIVGIRIKNTKRFHFLMIQSI